MNVVIITKTGATLSYDDVQEVSIDTDAAVTRFRADGKHGITPRGDPRRRWYTPRYEKDPVEEATKRLQEDMEIQKQKDALLAEVGLRDMQDKLRTMAPKLPEPRIESWDEAFARCRRFYLRGSGPKRLIGRLKCFFGRHIRVVWDAERVHASNLAGGVFAPYTCPRCLFESQQFPNPSPFHQTQESHD